MAGVLQIPASAQLGYNLPFDDDADGTVTKDIDNGPTELHSIFHINDNDDIVYLKLWDNRSPTIGSDAPDYQFPVAADGASDAVNFLANFLLGGPGARFSNGLSFAATTDSSTNGTTDPGDPTDVYPSTTGGMLRALGQAQSPASLSPIGGVKLTSLNAIRGDTIAHDEKADANLRIADASSSTLYGIKIDNTKNLKSASFLRLFDTGSPTVGTTDPDVICRCPAGAVCIVVFPVAGIAFGTACKYAMTKTGGTSGADSPDSAVDMELYLG